MMKKLSGLTVLLILACSVLAKAETKQINISRFGELDRYYIIFATRYGSTGHAFVIFGKEQFSKQSSSYEAYGFYPIDYQEGSSIQNVPDITHAIGRVPGVIVNEVKEGTLQKVSDMFIVQVDSTQYKQAEKVLQDWSAKDFTGKYWQAVVSDCVTFTIAVGEAIGLPMPDRGLFKPSMWLPELYMLGVTGSVEVHSNQLVTGNSRYTGTTFDSVFFGRGKLITETGMQLEGNFIDGKLNGFGTSRLPNGVTYQGNFVNNVPNGFGELAFGDGSSYRGNFVKGQPDGSGTLVYTDGRVYEGEFKKGVAAGRGRLRGPDGGRIEGVFVDGELNGRGTIFYNDGARLEGNFVKGKLAGEGAIYFKNGTRYEGAIKNELPNGSGKFYYGNGELEFEGRFEAGEPVEGRLYLKSKAVAEGKFKDWQLDGAGVLLLPDGRKYVGGFAYGQPHGEGIMSVPDGRRFEGNFEGLTLNGPATAFLSNGDRFQGNYVNGTPAGSGAYTFSDGGRLEAPIVNGQLSGRGTYTINGVTRPAEVRDGLLYAGDSLDRLDREVGRVDRPKDERIKVSLEIGPIEVKETDKNGRVIEHGIK